MKLKTFTPLNTASISRDNVAIMSISFKNGVFSFNKAAVEALGAQAGSAVILHQDEEDELNWMLSFVTEDGFLLRDNGKNTGLTFNSKGIAKTIQGIIDPNHESKLIKCKIVEEPTIINDEEYYSFIIHKSLTK